ncbi:YdeI/OmpD-associated family protein [Thalassorhabdomicrobium marinisediminis]|uniref:YdeI/OmpD-associated family protein n=1 Tax=Thalassorhabdomicrobium marinisediminis TaxID=2170577 RepID=UPI002493C151|nr:YdeI/OmpD-associated family protein [Thalassorhabdomicrobium marinisediminis]
MITDIEDYFSKGCGRCKRFDTPACSVAKWHDGVIAMRRICLDAGLTEHVKWGHPVYTHTGRNIAMIGTFQDDFRFTFMNAGLLKDLEGVLEAPGPNSATRSMVRFQSAAEVKARTPLLQAYLDEAMGYAEQGLKPPKTTLNHDAPQELTDALDADPALAEAFAALTPGRKRGYYMHIGSAKQSATRTRRIEKLRPQIFAGKGFNER